MFPTSRKENQDPRVGAPGCATFAVDVTDIDVEYEKLKEAGASFISPPEDIIRDDGRKTARCCFVLDPDGLMIELYEAFATLDKAK